MTNGARVSIHPGRFADLSIFDVKLVIAHGSMIYSACFHVTQNLPRASRPPGVGGRGRQPLNKKFGESTATSLGMLEAAPCKISKIKMIRELLAKLPPFPSILVPQSQGRDLSEKGGGLPSCSEMDLF